MRKDTVTPTVVRAVTLPVEQPVTPVAWGGLNESLRAAFALSTDLANWAVHHLFRLDSPASRETPAAVKDCYLYGDALTHFPDWAGRCEGVKATAQCVLRAVRRKYVQDRFAVQVRHESALLTYRYPFPYPVHNRDWSVSFAKGPWPGDAPVLVLPLPGLGRVHLKLARGPEFARQLAAVRQLIDGAAGKGEAALLRDRKGRLLAKLVGRFPRRERGPATNVALVGTDPNALLVVEINGHRANVTNADHIRREIARHRAFRQRAGEDKKRELRMDPRQRRNLNKYVAERCGKQNARLDTFANQVAAQVARMCQRRDVGHVYFDDADRSFFRQAGDDLSFPWHALKTRLRQLVVGEMGCGWTDERFTHLTDEKEKEEWLLERAKALATAGKRKIAKARRGPGVSHPAVSKPRATSCPPPGTRSKTSSTTRSRT